jgi:hypothetical protein
LPGSRIRFSLNAVFVVVMFAAGRRSRGFSKPCSSRSGSLAICVGDDARAKPKLGA